MVKLFQTQYPDSAGKPTLRVYVGLDFGTAFTKVVIANPTDSFAVKLRPDLGGINAYLQPGLLAEDAAGNLFCTASPTDRRSFQNLKLALMHVPDNGIARANVALFLASVTFGVGSRVFPGTGDPT